MDHPREGILRLHRTLASSSSRPLDAEAMAMLVDKEKDGDVGGLKIARLEKPRHRHRPQKANQTREIVVRLQFPSELEIDSPPLAALSSSPTLNYIRSQLVHLSVCLSLSTLLVLSTLSPTLYSSCLCKGPSESLML